MTLFGYPWWGWAALAVVIGLIAVGMYYHESANERCKDSPIGEDACVETIAAINEPPRGR